MKEYFAYVDESGDPIFNESASRIFFLGAILIEKEELEETRYKLAEVKNKYGVGEELKSSQISSFGRRLGIINDLADININCLSVWVKKRELEGEWFNFKNTFYKYIQSLLNHEIYRLFRNVSVTLDRYGTKEYRESLEKYLDEALQGELFDPAVYIGSAKNEELIQIADFFSGTLRKILRNDFSEKEKAQLLSILEPIWKVRIVIPDQGKYVNTEILEDSDKYLDYFVKDTRRYLDRETPKEKAKIRSLEYLYNTALITPDEFVYTDEILNWLTNFNIYLSKEEFRNKVTASLRDDGLIIIGTRKGLKLPTRLTDITDYLDFSINQALPILKRMKKAITTTSAHPDLPNLADTLSDEMRSILRKVNA